MTQRLLLPTIILLQLVFSLSTKAQSVENANPDICSVKNYLPVNHPHLTGIDVITQDKNGSMVFAYKIAGRTISFYDGTNWTYVDDSNYLLSNSVTDVFTDSKKNLWIATNKGLSMFDGTTWTKFPLTEYTEKTIMSIAEDKNDKIWFMGYGYAITFDGTLWKKVEFNSTEWMYDAVFDKDNTLWFRGYNCVVKYDGIKSTRYTTAQGLNSNFISKVCLAGGEIYCLYSQSDSISKFESNKWVNVSPPVKDGSGFRLILKDKLNQTWLLSNYGGLFKLDDDGWDKYIYFGVYGISSIYEDDKGNLWFGANGGQIVKYDSEGPSIITKQNNDGIPFQDISEVFADKKDRIWVRPNRYDNGISSFDGKKWTNYNFNPGNSRFILDANDTLYTGGGGIYKFNGKEWQYLNYSMGLSYSEYRGLAIDKKNRFWFSPGKGKVVMTDGKKTTEFFVSDGLLDVDISRIYLDRDSNVWVTYNNYQTQVSKYDGKQWTTVELPGKAGYGVLYSDAVCDSSGNMWFASSIGLIKYDRITKKTKTFNVYNSNMAFDNVYSLFKDEHNNIWMSSSNSNNSYFITKFSINDGTWKNYPVLNKNGYYYAMITLDSYGNAYLGDNQSGLYKIAFNATIPEFTKTNIACTGAADGNIKLHPANDMPYLYSIDNGVTFKSDTVFSQLAAGNYSLKAKNGSCISTETKTIELTEPNGVFKVDKKDVSCNGDSNGSISITTQDLNEISFNWSTGATSSSLTNLAKGVYTATITHSGTCNFQREFEINEPEVLSLRDSLFNYCGTSKGAIYLVASGGTKPYKYNWSNNKTSENNEGLELGTYSVTVKDDKNCPSIVKSFKIEAFPAISFSSMISSTKSYLCNETASISTNSDFSSYQWFRKGLDNNIATSKSITVSDSGLYFVKVVNSNNCFVYDTIKIVSKSKYELPQICLVTVDETTSKNKIVWNKFKADSLVQIIIEKESNQSDSYYEIGTVPSYQNGTFIDYESNPLARADRYRIKVSDECNNKSLPGDIHKTIHLTASIGSNGEVNLVWSGYEGFYFSSYNIYRGTSKSKMELLTTIQNNLNSYTDLNPPSGGVFYMLEALSPNVCNPDAFKSATPSTRSNFVDNGMTPVSSQEENRNIEISPNPSRGAILVKFDRNPSERVSIKLLDLTGKTVSVQNNIPGNSIVIERNGLPRGLYTLVIEGNEVYRRKVIFQ